MLNPITYATTSAPTGGVLSGLDATAGTVVYTPNQYFNGSDSFTYTATANGITKIPGTVNITVNWVNQPPVANPQSVSLGENGQTPTIYQ